MPLVQTDFEAEGERTLGFLDGEVRDAHVVKLRAQPSYKLERDYQSC